MTAETCVSCGEPVDRELPDPLPEGYELMLTEAMTGRAHYCQSCYDDQPEAES